MNSSVLDEKLHDPNFKQEEKLNSNLYNNYT